jgi:RNA polymerase sigma-70 factor (ECF subfamily)
MRQEITLAAAGGKDHVREEAVLLRRAQSGDHRAFEVVVKTYERRVVSTAHRLLGSVDDAWDVAQEVFVRLYRFLPRYDVRRPFFPWLYRIVVNACLDHARATRRRGETVPLDEMPPGAHPHVDPVGRGHEVRDKIYGLTDRLSKPQKTVFVLREVEGFSCREIASIMEISQGTVRSHLHHARKRLRDLLALHYPEFLEGMPDEMSWGRD